MLNSFLNFQQQYLPHFNKSVFICFRALNKYTSVIGEANLVEAKTARFSIVLTYDPSKFYNLLWLNAVFS